MASMIPLRVFPTTEVSADPMFYHLEYGSVHVFLLVQNTSITIKEIIPSILRASVRTSDEAGSLR